MPVFGGEGDIGIDRPFSAYVEVVQFILVEVPASVNAISHEGKWIKDEIGVHLWNALGECVRVEKCVGIDVGIDRADDVSVFYFMVETLGDAEAGHIQTVPSVLYIKDIMLVRRN